MRELTKREKEVVSRAADGESSKRIGLSLGISSRTVDAHIDSAKHKLKAKSRAHLIAIAIRSGIIASLVAVSMTTTTIDMRRPARTYSSRSHQSRWINIT